MEEKLKELIEDICKLNHCKQKYDGENCYKYCRNRIIIEKIKNIMSRDDMALNKNL